MRSFRRYDWGKKTGGGQGGKSRGVLRALTMFLFTIPTRSLVQPDCMWLLYY